MKKFAILIALLSGFTANAKPLDPVGRENLTMLVGASALAVYVAEYCTLPAAREENIQRKTKEVLMFAESQWAPKAVSEVYEQARAAAKKTTSAVAREVSCKPEPIRNLDEQFSEFADGILNGLKDSTK